MNAGERTGGPPCKRWAARLVYPMLVGALIGTFLLEVVPTISEMSATIDEPGYISAGYAYWTTHDGRLNAEHTPLIKLLIALPLLPLHLSASTRNWTWREGDEWGYFGTSLYKNRAALDEVMFRSRLPIVVLGALLALYVRRWAADLWGAGAGLIALLMLVFEPNILAQSGLATLDLGFTAFTFVAMYYAWKWMRWGRRRHAALACVALGCSLASKGPAPAFLPIFLLVLVVDHVMASRSGRPRHVAPVKGFLQLVLAAMGVVVAVYAGIFRWHPLGQHISVPAVSYYLAGVLYNARYALQGHVAFLWGHHSLHGWWYFYPIVFVLKTPLPILLLIAFRLLRLKPVPMVADEYVVVLSIVGVMVLACFSTLDIGIRYILPLYPFLFVWLSRIVAIELFSSQPNAFMAAQVAGPFERRGERPTNLRPQTANTSRAPATLHSGH